MVSFRYYLKRSENKKNRLNARKSLASNEVRIVIDDVNMGYKKASWY